MKTKFRNKHAIQRDHARQLPFMVRRHCPQCWKVTQHEQRIIGDREELICTICGKAQVYWVRNA